MTSKQEDLSELIHEIEPLCSEYDYSADVQANGFRSFLKIVQKFQEKIANDEVVVSQKQKIHGFFQTVRSLIQKTRDRGQDDFSKITPIDKEIMSASFAEAPTAQDTLFPEPIDAFWLEEDVKLAVDKYPELVAQFVNPDRDTIFKQVLSRNIVSEFRFMSIPHSNEWVIESTGTGSKLTRSKLRTKEIINCLILKPIENKHPNCLLFYAHGGGFMRGSAPSYVEQVAELCNKVGVVTVIPDHRNAPLHRFPAGLQDVLDSYCFFTSGSDTVTQILGFNPDKVILAGDSAGGNLCAGITFALHMIREAGGTVQMPAGIHLLYPYSSPVPIAYPSMLMQNLDPIITTSVIATMMASYSKSDPLIEIGRQAAPNCEEVMDLMQQHAEDPLVNNLAFKDWQSLKEIPLVVHVSEFDPLMDSGIQFAKRWQGNTRVRVAWGYTHEFARLKIESSRQELQVMYDDISDIFNDKF